MPPKAKARAKAKAAIRKRPASALCAERLHSRVVLLSREQRLKHQHYEEMLAVHKEKEQGMNLLLQQKIDQLSREHAEKVEDLSQALARKEEELTRVRTQRDQLEGALRVMKVAGAAAKAPMGAVAGEPASSSSGSTGANIVIYAEQNTPESRHLVDGHACEVVRNTTPLVETPPRSSVIVNSVQEVADLIAKSSRILVLTGAGISASCGIPTFRDSGGLYEAVAREYGLSSPEEVSDIDFFRRCPEPWFKKVQPIVPTASAPRRPSLTHRFLRLLEDRGKLLQLLTQNIDTLETVAGITRVTFCHGSFETATCMGCRRKEAGQATNEAIGAGRMPRCTDCGGIMKPDVVLFNEPLAAGVKDAIREHARQTDLLLVIGTSLAVEPCSLIPRLVGASGGAPRVLINKEAAGREEDFEGFLQGPCDEIVRELISVL